MFTIAEGSPVVGVGVLLSTDGRTGGQHVEIAMIDVGLQVRTSTRHRQTRVRMIKCMRAVVCEVLNIQDCQDRLRTAVIGD